MADPVANIVIGYVMWVAVLYSCIPWSFSSCGRHTHDDTCDYMKTVSIVNLSFTGAFILNCGLLFLNFSDKAFWTIYCILFGAQSITNTILYIISYTIYDDNVQERYWRSNPGSSDILTWAMIAGLMQYAYLLITLGIVILLIFAIRRLAIRLFRESASPTSNR